MTALLELLQHTQHIVSTSDRALHNDDRLPDGVDLLVMSNAMNIYHPLLMEARARNIPIVHRVQMLAQLLAGKEIIAVMGSDGKGSVTSLIAHITGWDFVCGSKSLNTNSYTRFTACKQVIVELDESDRSFYHIQPTAGILLNLNLDHLELYNNCTETYYSCLYDYCKEHRIACPTYQLTDWTHTSAIYSDCDHTFAIHIGMHAKYMVQNAAAATWLCLQYGVPIERIQARLLTYIGTEKRLHTVAQYSNNHSYTIDLVDDYGHTLDGIRLTIDALVDKYDDIMVVLQPHGVLRFGAMEEVLATVLANVSTVCVLPVYDHAHGQVPRFDHAHGQVSALSKSFAEKYGFTYIDTLEDSLALITPSVRAVVLFSAGKLSWTQLSGSELQATPSANTAGTYA